MRTPNFWVEKSENIVRLIRKLLRNVYIFLSFHYHLILLCVNETEYVFAVSLCKSLIRLNQFLSGILQI